MCVSAYMLVLSSSDEAVVGFPWAAKDRERSAKGPRKARREGGFEVKEYWTTPMYI